MAKELVYELAKPKPKGWMSGGQLKKLLVGVIPSHSWNF